MVQPSPADYAILGLTEGATEQEIEEAFERKCDLAGPDVIARTMAELAYEAITAEGNEDLPAATVPPEGHTVRLDTLPKHAPVKRSRRKAKAGPKVQNTALKRTLQQNPRKPSRRRIETEEPEISLDEMIAQIIALEKQDVTERLAQCERDLNIGTVYLRGRKRYVPRGNRQRDEWCREHLKMPYRRVADCAKLVGLWSQFVEAHEWYEREGRALGYLLKGSRGLAHVLGVLKQHRNWRENKAPLEQEAADKAAAAVRRAEKKAAQEAMMQRLARGGDYLDVKTFTVPEEVTQQNFEFLGKAYTRLAMELNHAEQQWFEHERLARESQVNAEKAEARALKAEADLAALTEAKVAEETPT